MKDRFEKIGEMLTPLRLFRGLLGTCCLLVGIDLLNHKHSHFDLENWFGFYGLFGFAACFVAVIAARLLRVIVSRDEGYYDE
jgi:hypothetical protein